MKRTSAMVISAGLVLALVAGTVSRVVTLHQTSAAAAPVRIVVQTAAPQGSSATAPAYTERD
jgi:hypothetical protein